MLTKQLWRFHDNPQSLVARLFAARYFPDGNILSASLGHHPSYVWRSFMDAMWVIRDGSRWLIGDGRRARFWRDPWLPKGSSFRVITTANGDLDSKVRDWMLETPMRWNVDKLNQHLLGFEVEEIRRIPLCEGVGDDKLIWHYEKNGEYSVKSGYHFIRWKKEQMEGQGSTSEEPTLWRKVWKLNVPPKVKCFLWRLLRGALPCAGNIQQRVKDANPFCFRCNNQVESDSHALMWCPFVQQVWSAAGFDWIDEGGRFPIFADLMDYISTRVRGEDLNKIIMVLWSVWNDRNREYHGGAKWEPGKIVDSALGYWKAWSNAQGTEKRKQPGNNVEMLKWKVPRVGFTKVNVDAGVMGELGCGLGVIVRDHNGRVERAGVQQVREMWDADIAEAKAMVFGLSTAYQMELHSIIVESDCLPLVTMIQAKSFPGNYFGNIGKTILELASRFSCVEFSFVRRDGNRAALSYSTRFWVGMVPESIAMVVSSDLESAINSSI